MANYLRNQLAKTMSRYFKNIKPEQFTLSFFRGEAELTDLELRPEVIQQLLGLPYWLILRKASVASIRCVVTWTKIKTVPIKLIIDEMQVKLEVTPNPTEKDFVELDPELYGYTDAPAKKGEKYGFIDGILDGVQLDITCIDVTVRAPDYVGTVHIIHVSLKNCDDTWMPTEDLRRSKSEDKANKILTLFKILTIHELRGVVSPMTPKIAEVAQSDPFTFNISQPRLRIFRRKSLLDNSKVLSMHMTLDITLIRQEVSRFHVQTLNHMVTSTAKIMAQTRGLNFNRMPDVEGSETSMADHGFHVKIKKLELWLRNHRKTRDAKDQYLTSLLMTMVTIHHFAEQPMGAQLRSKNALRQAYLTECGAWTKTVNSKWAKSVDLSKRDRKRLRQAATSVTIDAINIVTRRAESVKEKVNLKRSSNTGRQSTESQAGRQSRNSDTIQDRDSSLIELLQPNYSEYHLPADLALVQLDMVSYFIVDSAVSPQPRSDRTPSGNFREVPLPGPIMYSRVNPCRCQLNLSAMLQFLDFVNSCSIATPVFSSETTPQHIIDLGIQMSLCSTLAKLQSLHNQIEDLNSDVDKILAHNDMKELQRVHAIRREQLETSPQSEDDAEDNESGYVRFSLEFSLPTLILPGRVEGPSRVRELELRLICSRIKITNCMNERKYAGSLNFDAFYKSPLGSNFSEDMSNVSLKFQNDDSSIRALPKRAWLPSEERFDSQSTMHIHVDQMWGDLYNSRTSAKSTVLRPTTMSVWIFDATKYIEELEQQNESRMYSPDVKETTTPFDASSNYASSYTLVSLPQQLRLDISNSFYLFLMRFLDEFSRLNALLDDGHDLPRGVTFVEMSDVGVSLMPEPHAMANVSTNFKSHHEQTKFSEAFHHIHIQKLHFGTYSGKRSGKTLMAIEQLALSKESPRDQASSIITQEEWKQVSVALRIDSDMADPEHSYMYYQQLDQLLLYKEAARLEAGRASRDSSRASSRSSRALSRITDEDSPGSSVSTPRQAAEDSFIARRSDLDVSQLAFPRTPPSEVKTSPDNEAPDVEKEQDSIPLSLTPLGEPELVSGTATPNSPGRMTLEEFQRAGENFKLNFLPQPKMQIELRNIDLKLDSDELSLLGELTKDYFPDDVLPPSGFKLECYHTRATLIDLELLGLGQLDRFRLVAPIDSASAVYNLHGVSVIKNNNVWSIATIETTEWNPDKDRDSQEIKSLKAELEIAKAAIAGHKNALDIANGKIKQLERAQALSVQALAKHASVSYRDDTDGFTKI